MKPLYIVKEVTNDPEYTKNKQKEFVSKDYEVVPGLIDPETQTTTGKVKHVLKLNTDDYPIKSDGLIPNETLEKNKKLFLETSKVAIGYQLFLSRNDDMFQNGTEIDSTTYSNQDDIVMLIDTYSEANQDIKVGLDENNLHNLFNVGIKWQNEDQDNNQMKDYINKITSQENYADFSYQYMTQPAQPEVQSRDEVRNSLRLVTQNGTPHQPAVPVQFERRLSEKDLKIHVDFEQLYSFDEELGGDSSQTANPETLFDYILQKRGITGEKKQNFSKKNLNLIVFYSSKDKDGNDPVKPLGNEGPRGQIAHMRPQSKRPQSSGGQKIKVKMTLTQPQENNNTNVQTQ
ncbi:hypothetical protein ['Camptotheca acuminata' phytoplasma]|uniref:hypothetical protein n=1 Tax='Camptotheca acuminata' phytoplasma TaxID=3239192 RepID=UPI00351A751D